MARNSAVPEDVKTKGLRKLFIGGFGSEVQVHHLEEYFSGFGSITNAYIIYDPKSKVSKSNCISPSDFGYLEFETIDQATSALKNGPHFLFGKRLTLEYQKNGRVAAYSLTNESPSGTHTTEGPSLDQGTKNKSRRISPIKQNEKLRSKHVEGRDPKPSSKKLLNTSCRLAEGQPCFPLVTNLSSNQNKGFNLPLEAQDLDHAVDRWTRQMHDTQRVPDSANEGSALAECAKKPSFTESRMQEFYRHLKEHASTCSNAKIRPSLNNEVRESRNYRFNTDKQNLFRVQNTPLVFFFPASTQTPPHLTRHRTIHH